MKLPLMRRWEAIELYNDGDERLMKEIEEKAKTGKKEDVIESLNLFEKNWRILPNGPARDFIYQFSN